VEFARELARRIKATGITDPKRGETEAVIQPDRDVGGDCVPFAVDVARPNPTAVTLRTCVSGAVKTPWTDIGSILERTFVIAAMTGEPCFEGQFISVVGPPAIDTKRKRVAMAFPVIRDVQRRIGIFSDGTAK